MRTLSNKPTDDIRRRMVDIGGRTAQDLGLSRVVGQILVYLYLQPCECALDQVGSDLGLSKASVSIGIRQLENLGFATRVWKKGDRRNYYRSADNIASALRQGLLTFVAQKVRTVSSELDAVHEMIEAVPAEEQKEDSVRFLRERVDRARRLQQHVSILLGNPLIKLLGQV